MVQGIRSGGAGAASAGRSIGVAAANAIRAGFGSGSSAIVNAVRTCIAQANAAALAMVPKFQQAGQQMAGGVASGVDSRPWCAPPSDI